MEALVVVHSPPADFDFHIDTAPPSPSTPARFGDYRYFSAPASPACASRFFRDFDEFVASPGDSSSVAFEDGDDFAFDYRAELEEELLSAEELFDGGMIRPLKLPSHFQQPRLLGLDSLSPLHRKESRDVCMEGAPRERGRERAVSSSPHCRTARSHSPLRVSTYPWEEEDCRQQDTSAAKQKSTSSSSSTSSKKWSIKDLLLFRSASEGSATDKNHPFGVYSGIFRRQEEAAKNFSGLGLEDSSSSNNNSGSTSRRRGRVSAHELHYTENKAASECLKKKTFLPYKQGILGRLSFNPTVHSTAKGFGSLPRHQL
ncbi:hypothetical protein MLD38_034442 [Melastoma candidum]|uniref:Uncharacterized protein n=1 Tax=Melastoma candidum TaxID=119954 RepID=A0ACB9MAK1_9MYRT|nr:hypothetical protein MLD38_034442 [Melastoma candidum]